jgi:hypothetical protein
MPIHHVTYAMPNARNAQRKAIHMLQRSSHTKLTNYQLLEGRKKGSTPPAKSKGAQNSQAPPKHMHKGQRAYKAHPTHMR